jgi:Phosphorylase superfamily
MLEVILFSFLTHLQEEVHEQGTIYERGTFVGNGVSWNVGIAEVEGGNAEAGIETERAIRHFEPNVLLSVGIAEGIEDCVKIGDVIVATKVYVRFFRLGLRCIHKSDLTGFEQKQDLSSIDSSLSILNKPELLRIDAS